MHASTLKYFAHSFYINRNDDPQHVLGCLHACVLLLCDRSAISSLVCHAHEPLEVPESRLWTDFLIYKFQYVAERRLKIAALSVVVFFGRCDSS